MFRGGLTALPVSDGEEKEAESKLHESYQALYRDMLDKFTKFGLQEYHAVSWLLNISNATGAYERTGAATWTSNSSSFFFIENIRSWCSTWTHFSLIFNVDSQVVGENYDASVHEKTGEIEVGGAETENDSAPGTITEEMASGLKMPHGVVRRAKVVVAVSAPSPAESEDETEKSETEAKEGKDEASANNREEEEEEEEATETEEENDSTSDEVAEWEAAKFCIIAIEN
jgi:hypothetical protein